MATDNTVNVVSLGGHVIVECDECDKTHTVNLCWLEDREPEIVDGRLAKCPPWEKPAWQFQGVKKL